MLQMKKFTMQAKQAGAHDFISGLENGYESHRGRTRKSHFLEVRSNE